jgi:hypothetical protein
MTSMSWSLINTISKLGHRMLRIGKVIPDGRVGSALCTIHIPFGLEVKPDRLIQALICTRRLWSEGGIST